MCVIRARQIRKIKINPLRKKRFKPQVSAVFDAGSIRIDAYRVNPKNSSSVCLPKIRQRSRQILCDRDRPISRLADFAGSRVHVRAPSVGQRLIPRWVV
jgi:hypothetical protein